MSSPPAPALPTPPANAAVSTSPPRTTLVTPAPPPVVASAPAPVAPTVPPVPTALPFTSQALSLDNAEEGPTAPSPLAATTQTGPAGLAGVAPPSTPATTRAFGLPGQPAPVPPAKGITPNYTIRKTNLSTRPPASSAPHSAAPATVTPATPAPPTTNATPASAASAPVFPALHLTPLNDTFVPKQISLVPVGQKVKIGRQTNAKTVPNGTNGFFDSKVLSRMHAEVWCEGDKVLIKDVKSSNGTFINGTRLSPEAAESDVFELHTDDIVEFGIDIVSDDSKTIVHHKVAAKVFLVMNADDALASSREFNNWYRNVNDSSQQIHRRGAKSTSTGTNGLSFDHVLSRLQGELQKSRDTGTNLGDLSTALSDVHDTLGGGIPPPPSFANTRVSPYLANGASKDPHAQSIAALQLQLNETQNSLAGHVGKIRDLEGLLAEHDVIKREVGTLRKQMEDAQRDMEFMMRGRSAGVSAVVRDGRQSPVATTLDAQEAAEEDDDNDDARSIVSTNTIKLNTAEQPSSLPSAQLSTAQPNGIAAPALSNGTGTALTAGVTPAGEEPSKGNDEHARERQLQEQNATLAARLETLSVELDEATKLGQLLRSQHAEASSAIRTLEARVLGLEKAVEGRVAEAEGKVLEEAESRWKGWREAFEESWKKERASWESEREKLTAAVREWEEQKKMQDDQSDWDSSGDDEDAGEDAGASVAEVGSGTTTKVPKAKRPRSRRRRRLTATRVSTLAAPSGIASDSDSTIGDASKAGPSGGVWSGPQRGVPPGASRRGFDGAGGTQGGVGSSHSLPLASAGAVIVVGIAAAWALSFKLKE